MAVKNLATSVIVQYKQLVAGKDVLPLIEQAYGPQGIFATMQAMEFSSLMASPTTPSNARRPSLFSTDWPTSPRKSLRNTNDLKSFTLRHGPTASRSFKANLIFRKAATT
jgi:hypothetical protein